MNGPAQPERLTATGLAVNGESKTQSKSTRVRPNHFQKRSSEQWLASYQTPRKPGSEAAAHGAGTLATQNVKLPEASVELAPAT